MKLPFTNTFAAIAAAIFAFTSIGTIASVPPAHAASPVGLIELA